MKNKKRWINLALLNLFVVAFLGMTLRSKILFSLSFIDFNNLIDAHEYFAFGGWVTLILMVLMVYDLLPAACYERKLYQWLFGFIFLSSWGLLVSYNLWGHGIVSNYFHRIFIFTTYIFGFQFVRDAVRSKIGRPVLLLSICALTCLALSSLGPFALEYLFSIHSRNAILYRDALFTFLHLQYNGFFTLSVFALFFSQYKLMEGDLHEKKFNVFAILLCLSIVPSLFLSYLWQNPNKFFWIIAMTGSLLLVLTFIWFISSLASLKRVYMKMAPITKFLMDLSMAAFMLKLILHSFTILPSVGDAVFGDRPMIIGFLHLVFLGFVTLFLMAYLGDKGELNIQRKFTRIALIIFTTGVFLNEVFLMIQGLGAMFIKSSSLFPQLLWIASIILFIGALLTGIARIKINSIERQ